MNYILVNYRRKRKHWIYTPTSTGIYHSFPNGYFGKWREWQLTPNFGRIAKKLRSIFKNSATKCLYLFALKGTRFAPFRPLSLKKILARYAASKIRRFAPKIPPLRGICVLHPRAQMPSYATALNLRRKCGIQKSFFLWIKSLFDELDP